MNLKENHKIILFKINWSLLLFGVICDFNIIKDIHFFVFKLNLQSSTISAFLFILSSLLIADLKIEKHNLIGRENKDVFIFGTSMLLVAIISSLLSSEMVYALNITVFRITLYYFCFIATIIIIKQFPDLTNYLIYSVITAGFLNSIAVISDFFIPSFNKILIDYFQHFDIHLQSHFLNGKRVTRPSGFVTDPNLAGYLTGLSAIMLLINYKLIKYKFFILLNFIITGFAFSLMSSKSAFLAVFCSVISFLFVKLISRKATIIFLILFLFLPFLTPYNMFSLSMSNTSYFKDESTTGRALIWKASYKCFKESPVIGIGTGVFFKKSYDVMAEILASENKNMTKEYIYNSFIGTGSNPHSLFISVLVEYGIIGFVILVWFIIKYFLGLYHEKKIISMIGFTGLLAVSTLSQYAPHFKLYIILCIFLYISFKTNMMITETNNMQTN